MPWEAQLVNYVVWANPESKREKIEKIDGSTYEISVKQPAERNLANTRIRELLAHELSIPVNRVRMISGHWSGSKIFSVPDV